MNTQTHDPIARMQAREKRELDELNRISLNLWGVTYNDENEPVTLDVWCEGDRRDGVREIYWRCDNPPKDIEDFIYDFIYDKEQLCRADFKGDDGKTTPKIIRWADEVMKDAMEEQPAERIAGLQLILSLASTAIQHEPTYAKEIKIWSDFAKAAADKSAKRKTAA